MYFSNVSLKYFSFYPMYVLIWNLWGRVTLLEWWSIHLTFCLPWHFWYVYLYISELCEIVQVYFLTWNMWGSVMQYAFDLLLFPSLGEPNSQASIYQQHHYHKKFRVTYIMCCFCTYIMFCKNWKNSPNPPGIISVRHKSNYCSGQKD